MKTLFSGFAHRVWVVLLVSLMGASLASCSKDDAAPADYSATDDALIQKYLTDNNITNAVKQPSGVYYVPVVTNATAPLATTGKVVSILYTNQLLNGTVFDATSQRNNNPFNFILGVNRIQVAGIEQGLALMHKGDKATLLIPSGLAYGPGGAGTAVPANSVIRSDIELTDINSDFTVPDDNIIKKYLADNNITTAVKQASGLYYVPGKVVPTGTPAVRNTTVSVLYTGRLMDGTIFDASSRNNNLPISFVLGRGQVIPGWDEGIALMRKGETGQLLIPSALAYGPAGAGTAIAPNTVLRFEVEVTDVK
jgi:FKBP-type peptidyl-prolyl cis-trans isomerase